MDKFIRQEETYSIIGVCMEVHRELGPGFSEIIYKDAIEIEAAAKDICIHREKKFEILYKERKLPRSYFADFVMHNDIIVEIKATNKGIAEEHISQTLNYLRASGCNVGLIVNFGKKSLEYKRLVL